MPTIIGAPLYFAGHVGLGATTQGAPRVLELAQQHAVVSTSDGWVATRSSPPQYVRAGALVLANATGSLDVYGCSE